MLDRIRRWLFAPIIHRLRSVEAGLFDARGTIMDETIRAKEEINRRVALARTEIILELEAAKKSLHTQAGTDADKVKAAAVAIAAINGGMF
jgi:alkylhydroperoxidase family enzyme